MVRDELFMGWFAFMPPGITLGGVMSSEVT